MAADPSSTSDPRAPWRRLLPRSLLLTLALAATIGGVATLWGGISFERTQHDAVEELDWRLRSAEASLGTLLETAARVSVVLAATVSPLPADHLDSTGLLLDARKSVWRAQFEFDLIDDLRAYSSTGEGGATLSLPPPPLAGQAMTALVAGQAVVGAPYRRDTRWMLPVYVQVRPSLWVVASIDLGFVAAQWEQLGMPAEASIALVGPDQRVWQRMPQTAGALNLDVSRDPMLHGALASGRASGDAGTYLSPVDGIERRYAWSAVSAAPALVLVAGMPTSHIAGTWRMAFGLPTVITLILTATMLGAAPGMLMRARRAEAARQAAVAQLRTTEERWQFALEGSNVGVWDWDITNDRVFFSERWKQMLGYAETEVGSTLGEWSERLHPEDRAAVHAALAPHLDGRTPHYESEHRLRCKDGSYKWVLDRGKVVARDADGAPLRAVGTHTDIADRKRAEQAVLAQAAAERASRAKSEFLSRMSHELRTPLNAVLGFAQLLRHDPARPLDAHQRERVMHIERGGEHLLAMINDVLDLTRIESDHLPVKLEPIRVADAAAEAISLLSTQAAAMDVQVALRSAPHEAMQVQADATRLRQVLVNLLSNAIKYNRRGGRVELSARLLGTAVAIEVQDSGQGLSETQLANLFQPFNRLGAEASKVDGTGIGLVLSKRLAQLMGGDLALSSEAGVGTCATLTLRAAGPTAETAEADGAASGFAHSRAADPFARAPSPPPAIRATPVDGVPLRLLYIEDSPEGGLLLRQLLRLRPRVDMAIACDAVTALHAARQHPRAARPQLVLVDVSLPEQDGSALLAQLRDEPALAQAWVCALASGATAATALRGFDSVLPKPIEVSAFVALIDRVAATALPLQEAASV